MHHANLYLSKKDLPDLTHIDRVDYVEITESKLTIDTVRNLINQAYQQPCYKGGVKAVVVITNQILLEAQNALLKILEEPPAHTNFYFVVSDHTRLLPTLRSRFSVGAHKDTVDTSVAHTFMYTPLRNRLEMIAERTSARDMVWQKALLSGLEKIGTTQTIPQRSVKEILFIQQHINGPGSSAKMLLEHLALLLPYKK